MISMQYEKSDKNMQIIRYWINFKYNIIPTNKLAILANKYKYKYK